MKLVKWYKPNVQYPTPLEKQTQKIFHKKNSVIHESLFKMLHMYILCTQSFNLGNIGSTGRFLERQVNVIYKTI